MSKSVSKANTGSGGPQDPLEPVDFLSQYGAKPTQYANVTVQDTFKQSKYDPDQYEYVTNPSSADQGNAELLQAARQPLLDVATRSLKQFGANLAGAFATAALNTADVKSTFDVLAAKQTDFNSEIFGVNTRDLMEWTQSVQAGNRIYEKDPGGVHLGSASWWGNQIASAGTGVGMGVEALIETAAVTYATEGLGTIPEIMNIAKKFPQTFRMLRAAKTAEQAAAVTNTLSKIKRTATTYAIMNRLNESKMEAQQTFEESFNELRNVKNGDGTPKFTDEEARDMASSGARRDFLWNMPLMALDVLAFRTMVFNPFNGAGTGLIEKGLANAAGKMAKAGIAGKLAGRALPFVVGSVSEGAEEGLQFIGSQEGKHYAKVLAGMDNGDSFLQRVGKNVTSSEFWNSFSGGVIGSPIIGGSMKLFNKAVNGRSQRRLNELHRDFVSNVGKMDDHASASIRSAEDSGNIELANVLRRNYGVQKAMSALFIDGKKGGDAAFDSYVNFLNQTLNEVNQGKTDSLNDLGFSNISQDQVDNIKQHFQTYVQDANRMKRIFNEVAMQHESQHVPQISFQMFEVETRREKNNLLSSEITAMQPNVFGYSSLTPQGKQIHDLNYELLAHKNERRRLEALKKSTSNSFEQANIQAVIDNTQEKLSSFNERLKEISADPNYSAQDRDSDAGIIDVPVKDSAYYNKIRERVGNTSEVDITSRDLTLWNKEAYRDEQATIGIANSRNEEQLDQLEKSLTDRGKMTDNIQQVINARRKKLAAQEAVDQHNGRTDDVTNPTATNPTAEAAGNTVGSPALTNQVQNQNVVEVAEAEGQDTGSVLPQNNKVAANPTSPTLAGENAELFNSEEIQTIEAIANQLAGRGNSDAALRLINATIAKTEIINIDDLVNDEAGRIEVTYDGTPIKFRVFDLIIDPTAKVASISYIPDLGNRMSDYAPSVIKLGLELQKRGIQLSSAGLGGTNENRLLWEALGKMGYAVMKGGIGKDRRYDFLGEMQDPEAQFTGPVEENLAPVEVNDNMTEDQRERLKNAVNAMLADVPAPSFEDLVRKTIKQSNLETADKTFNLLIRGWELNGYPRVDYRQTYSKIFIDPIGTLNSLLGELGKTNDPTVPVEPEQIAEATQAAIESAIVNEAAPNDFDNDGQPIYDYTGVITGETAKKFAFLTVPYELTTTVNPDGSITVNKESVRGVINEGTDVDSLKLLDPNKYIKGTQMDVAIPSNFMEIVVSTFKPDGTPGQAMPFGQFVAENNLTPDSQLYRDKIPMIIYDKGNSGGRGVALVHDVQWYNPINFNQSKPGQMDEAIASTREMRGAVLAGMGKPVSITITAKRETTFEGLKMPQGTKLPIGEVNPEADIVVAKSIQTLSRDGANLVYENQLTNTKPFSKDMAYDVRQTGTREGKPVYTAFPLDQVQLSDSSKQSIFMALKVFVNKGNTTLVAGDKAIFDNVHTQILATSGIDIRSINGLQQYLGQFMFVQYGNPKNILEAEAIMKGQGKKEGYKYLIINQGGGILFGTVGKPMTPKNNGFFVNPNPGQKDAATAFKTANGFLNNIISTKFLEGYQQHAHYDSMNKNKPVVQVNMKGEITTTPSYKQYLQKTLLTNVRSLNIGTAVKPNYVTNVQPIITYELTSKIKQNGESISKESLRGNREEIRRQENGNLERRQETGSQGEETQEKVITLEERRKAQSDLIREAREELGFDFLNSEEDVDLLSPREITEQERESIEQSVQSIAGLNPQQQSELIDFMYNQVVSQIDVDNKEGVSKEQVFAEVKKSFEAVVKPLRKTYLDRVRKLKEAVAADPESPLIKELNLAIASYEKGIQRINDIQASYSLMEAETELRVSKYTNIQKGRSEYNEEEEDEDTEEDNDAPFQPGDGSREREKEFGTDTLSENPDNKLTYAMRRFLGQIRKVDKNGNPATGFLKLPIYVGQDTVASTVRDLLADVPSDFNTMMDKLETKVPAHPWLRELIDRLKASNKERQNQFVTVMSNHRLSMKFSMIAYDNKTKTWSSKVYDTFQSGLANQLAISWNVNFIDSPLVTMVNEVYTLDPVVAQHLVDEYDSWIGANIPELNTKDFEQLLPSIGTISSKKPTLLVSSEKFTIPGMENLKDGEKAKFKFRNIEYQVTEVAGFYQISYLNKTSSINPTNVRTWLDKIGVVLSDQGFTELMTNGLRHNFKLIKGDALFIDPNGLFRILSTALRTGINSPNKDLVTGDGNPLGNSVIKSLANLESNFNTSVNSPNGRDGGKSIFGFTAPKFITDRTRDLKADESRVRDQLATISFSKKALWLDLLVNSNKFRDQFAVSHIGLTAMKEMGKKVYKDNGITKLSDVDHELTKLIMFWDSKQGEVILNNQLNTYGDSTIPMRMATMFVPTMSDKSNMMLLKTAVLTMEDKHFVLGTDSKPAAGKEMIKAIYEQTVRPELLRMIKHAQNGGKTNISSYDKGAKMFLLMPSLNNIPFNDKLTIPEAIANGVEVFNLEYFESRVKEGDYMDLIYKEIGKVLNELVSNKLKVWGQAGFLDTNDSGNITGFEFMDKKYSDKFTGTPEHKAIKAAIDFEANSVISNANSFMLYAGDPAVYYKSKSNDAITAAKETFVNVGKRLANQIAPGTTIANSENEQYIQLFIQDRVSIPETKFLKFATRVNDGTEITDKEIETLQSGTKEAKSAIAKRYPKSAGYFSIEGADAQEYTTWREHLSLLERLGKTSDSVFEVTPDEIQEARELFASYENGKRAKLTAKQEKLIGKVLQPMKPVYTGQIYDETQDVMRTVYIKSSSFPLIPQMTGGLEIDKLRVAMEAIEKKEKRGVRASYQTANKVGSVTNPANIWNAEGRMNFEELGKIGASSLVLDRKNFRIQQDVPFKSGKRLEDKVTIGTQLMKILFGNGVIDLDGFMLDGKEHTGKELHEQYNKAFNDLVKNKRTQLLDELGLDESGNPIDEKKSIKKLQQILKDEAIGRNYPIQDIEGLNLDSNGNFIAPLWSSANSNRYEAMLNAIVGNRMVKPKFPGNSYVVGSEEGIKAVTIQEGLSNIDESKIVWTSKWTGSLQGSYKENGQIQKAQVLVASKFRDNKGELIDLLATKDGEYIYVEQLASGRFILREDMIDPALLSLTSFRIPTSGHVSAAQVEIAGFLPAQNADLMIVPRNFTKQMGLDFDVDKQYTYQLWHHMTKEGKFVQLNESIKEELLNEVYGDLKDGKSESKLLAAFFGDELKPFTFEEIQNDTKLKMLNAKIEEKLLQNKIVKIHSAVLTNPSDKIQSKINGILSTDYAEDQADLIDGIINATAPSTTFTPLSSEYQKMKMGLGAAGKIGTGAYSLDVTFHSLIQQAASLGRPLQLTEPYINENEEQDIRDKEFRFGTQVSTGQLGREMTIDGDRSIAEVLAELQNVALDNEKLQVMGRVGLNDLTIDVSKAFALMGFDKGTDKGKSSVQFLFLSQPIVREYVKRMKNASSNMAEFSQDKQQMVITQLLGEFYPEGAAEGTWSKLSEDEAYQDQMSRRMGTTEMLAALQSQNPDGALQEAILHRFLEMQKYGVMIRNIQTGINADAKGLGKSFFDVIARKEALNKLGAGNPFIQGGKGLIGDYVSKADFGIDYPGWKDYVDIGNYMIKPTTLTGSFNVYAVTTAYNLWNKHLPYDTAITNLVYDEIMEVISQGGDESLIDNKGVILKQEIFKNMKKYFSANAQNGIINNTDDINAERARLYIDTETNMSLAKYMKYLRDMSGNKTINDYIKTNKLLNRFEFDIQKNGTPSLIKFNNAVGEEFDEQYLYNSLGYLLSANKTLPDYNGKPYTTTRLAQDLVTYTMLGNATQEAIQFAKYIPVVYTNLVGYGDFMRKIAGRLSSDVSVLGAKLQGNDTETTFDSDFTTQFLQHNPERVRFKLPAKEIASKIHTPNKGYKSGDLNTLESFSLVMEEGAQSGPKYISIYNKSIPKGEKKFQLYVDQGDGVYKRIAVLGTFGMDEYNAAVTANTSLVNAKPKAVVTPKNTTRNTKPAPLADRFGVNSGNAKTVLENIAKANIQGLSDLAAALAPYSSNINIKYDDIISDGTANANNIRIRQNIAERGDYHTALTILHEVVHGLTVQQIKPYVIESNGTYQVTDKAPAYVSKLVQLYNVARGTIGEAAIKAIQEKVAAQRKLNGELSAASTEAEKLAIKARANNLALTPEEKTVYYGAFNINEFMAMALTQPEFQREMAKHEFKNTGMSLLDKFKEILNSILSAIGVDYSEKSVTAQAINSIFELITDKNENSSTPNTQRFNDIAEGGFTAEEEAIDAEFRKMLEENRWEEGETESLSIAILPSVQNVNENNCY